MKNNISKIITDKEKLAERVDEIDFNENEVIVRQVVNDLKDTMIANPSILALAAPQIGYPYRIFCMKFGKADSKNRANYRTFINPMISKTSEKLHLSREKRVGCDTEYIIPRHDNILAMYQTLVCNCSNVEHNEFAGISAELFQHMVQLLDGVLVDDIGLEVLDGFDSATEEERSQIISLYLDSLKETNSALQKEINANESLKEMNDAINFMAGVANGTVKLEKQ